MDDKYSLLWRPQTFDEICGNVETINLLKEKSRINKLGKMLIVHGTSGIGKTTLIYVIAKAFLCKELGTDGNPCCRCESCNEIQNSLYITGKTLRGSSVEIFDMGKDGDEFGYINKIVQRVNAPFTVGRRVLILEEMHNTSLKNQQKLNTSLEYIPDGVLVLMPTSDFYSRISSHLKTRSDNYMMTNPDREQIVDYLHGLSSKVVLSTGQKVPTKTDIKKLVTLKNSNMRACVDSLSLLIDCGDIGREYLMGDHNKRIVQFIGYLKAIKMGIIALTEYVADIPDKSLFLQHLPKLLEQGISLRSVASDLIEPSVRKEINSLMQDISEIKVARLIRTMPNVYDIQEEDARMYLWSIGIELNVAMIPQINLSDEENSIDVANQQVGTIDIMGLLGGVTKDNSSPQDQIKPFGSSDNKTEDREEDTESNLNTIFGEFNIDEL